MANGQPAVAIHHKAPEARDFALTALEVLAVRDGQIVEIVDFSLPNLYRALGWSRSGRPERFLSRVSVVSTSECRTPRNRKGRRDEQRDAPDPGTCADLQALSTMVGTWTMTGEAEGSIRYEWMEGGYFLLQHVDLVQYGQTIKGLEIIGHLRPFGEDPDPEIRSRFVDNMGNTLDYVYEPIDENTIKIWGGEKGSPAYCIATVSSDGNTVESEWVYHGGGGYKTTGTRTNPT